MTDQYTDDTYPIEIRVTAHAKKRFKQRLGLPKSACQAQAERAFHKGFTHKEAIGKAHRYFSRIFHMERNANNLRAYGNAVYVFNGTTLITVWELPKNMRNHFKRQN